MCYVDGSSTKCFDEQCEDEYLLSKPAYDCTGNVSLSETCIECPKKLMSLLLSVTINYSTSCSVSACPSGCADCYYMGVTKMCRTGGCKAGYVQAADGGCHCEYEDTGMGATVSTRVQGWVPL